MLKRRLSKTMERAIAFCERCGAMCGSTCRAVSIRRRAFDSAMRHGWRPL